MFFNPSLNLFKPPRQFNKGKLKIVQLCQKPTEQKKNKNGHDNGSIKKTDGSTVENLV